ncbi:MAG: glycosyltransferase family 4 protein [Candidatus Babeliaceae bacterium]|nr:glycosyltransferase family 4 protein [Candidatus Babeliaceae bacterium]
MKHIVHIITGLQRGGAETVLVTLATELAHARHAYRQSVIYFKDGPLRAPLEKLGISCYQVRYVSILWLIKKLNPDIIHSSLWSATIIARLYAAIFSIPTYCALHTVSEHSGIFRNVIDAILPFKPTKFIAVSEQVKKSYEKFLPAQKIAVIENGIPAAQPKKAMQKQDRYTIGAIGRFVPVKNYQILLDAFACVHREFPHTELVMIGHGLLEQKLREQAYRLNISDAVTFIINKPAHEWYCRFDCFVQPSAHEGFSLTAAEALQAKVPVIVTGKNKQHIFIKHEKHGLVIEPNSEQALCYALTYYIRNPEVALNYAQAGNSYVQQHFSSAAMAQKYHILFNSNVKKDNT